MGGSGGSAVAKACFSAILVAGLVKPVVFIVVAPFMGLTIALLLYVALSWLLRRALPRRVDRVFRVLQLGSAAAYSLGHGTNDAQKTRSEEHTSELQSPCNLVCRLLLEKKKTTQRTSPCNIGRRLLSEAHDRNGGATHGSPVKSRRNRTHPTCRRPMPFGGRCATGAPT